MDIDEITFDLFLASIITSYILKYISVCHLIKNSFIKISKKTINSFYGIYKKKHIE
jgi:hypothetical protein